MSFIHWKYWEIKGYNLLEIHKFSMKALTFESTYILNTLKKWVSLTVYALRLANIHKINYNYLDRFRNNI